MSTPIRLSPLISSALSTIKKPLLVVALFSAVINLLMLAPSIYMLQVYDRVLSSGNSMTLLMLSLMVLGCYLLMGVLEWLRSLVVIRLGAKVDTLLNAKVFTAMYRHRLLTGSNQAAQALSDLTQIRQFATGNALFAFFDAPWFPIYVGVMFLFHPALGWFSLAAAVLLIALAWLNQKTADAPLKVATELSNQANQGALAQFRQADSIAAMGMLGAFTKRWQHQHHQFLAWQNLASERTALFSALSKAVRMALQSFVLGLGAYLVLQQQVSAGVMIAGSILLGRVLAPIDLLIAVWKQFSQAKQSFERVNRLLNNQQEAAKPLPLPTPKGELRLEAVSASAILQGAICLKQLSFQLAAGETLGILGLSGSGKSTLARLLVGAVNPIQGVVRLDGADLRHFNPNELGKHIGYLPQDVQLFAGTVAENICRFGEQNAEDIIASAQLAQVHDLILQLPKGYDTPLGEGGAGLSGGQKQRVGLARALYQLPPMIVLDEPNANLDQQGEMALKQALAVLKQQGKTLVVISHKAELLEQADKLLILENGMLRIFGEQQQVLAHIQGKPSATKAPKVTSMPSISMSYKMQTPE